MLMLMFKFFFLLFSFLFSFNSYSYWQQRVEYKISIDFDHKNHQFLGEQNLKYFNMPSQKRIDILRNLIAPKVLNFYPQFAKKLWFN